MLRYADASVERAVRGTFCLGLTSGLGLFSLLEKPAPLSEAISWEHRFVGPVGRSQSPTSLSSSCQSSAEDIELVITLTLDGITNLWRNLELRHDKSTFGVPAARPHHELHSILCVQTTVRPLYGTWFRDSI